MCAWGCIIQRVYSNKKQERKKACKKCKDKRRSLIWWLPAQRAVTGSAFNGSNVQKAVSSGPIISGISHVYPGSDTEKTTPNAAPIKTRPPSPRPWIKPSLLHAASAGVSTPVSTRLNEPLISGSPPLRRGLLPHIHPGN